jgi:DNA-binding NarL/FixJ family response regulator
MFHEMKLVKRETSANTMSINEAMERAHRARPSVALTRRQREALQLLALGMTDGEIAAAMDASLSTTKKFIAQVYARLGVGTGNGNPRVIATLYAVRVGLVPAHKGAI